MRRSGVTSIASLVALGAAFAFAGDPAADLTDEDRADLAWFEALGYPKLGGLPIVEVHPGWDRTPRGFLLSDDGARFRVLGLDLSEVDYVRTPAGTPADRRVAYEGLDAERVAERWLDGGAAPGGEPPDFPFGEQGSSLTQAFVFACAMHQGGRQMFRATIHDLLVHARTLRPRTWPEDDPKAPLRDRVAADLARLDHSRANEALVLEKDGAAARRRALDAHRAVVRRFPRAPEAETSQRLVAALERMVREDGEHVKAAKPLDQLTGDERVAALVFALRDQRTNGFSVNGGMGQIVDGPYRELVAMGPAAVPRLVAAIGDDGVSCCVSYGQAGWPVFAYPVGQLAFDALVEIAGRQFAPPEGVKIEEYYGTKWREACRPSIEAWWAEVQKGGEVASLAKVVEAGGYGAVDAAEMLAAKGPERFAEAVAKGLRATKEWDTRQRLIGVASKHPSDAVTAVLLEEMRTSPTLHPRVAAATALLPVRRDDAVAAMLGEWRLRREGKAPPPADDGSGSPIDETSPLVGFFVAAQDPAAIRELGEGLAERPMKVRVETYGTLAHALGLEWRWIHDGWWGDAKLADAAAIAAAEEVLALALGDVTAIDEEVLGPSNQRGYDLRLADVAAAAIAIRRVGGPTVMMSVEQRARAAALVANAWRKERGIAEVAVPAAPEVARVADADIAPKLAWFTEKAHDWTEVKARLDAIESLGLGALAPLNEFLAVGDRGTWDRHLRDLAGKLAFHVRRVEVDASDAALPAAFRTRIESWRGRALSGGDLASLAGDLIGAAPPRLARFVLVADRPGDGTGVVVTLRCTEGDRPNRAAYWTRVVSALRGAEDVGPHTSYGSVVTPVAADFIADGAERPFTATPGERAYVRIDVR
jgi:hypothetical protein